RRIVYSIALPDLHSFPTRRSSDLNSAYIDRIVADAALPNGRSEMDSAHHLLHRDRLGRQRRLGALVALGRRAVGEHPEARVHHEIGREACREEGTVEWECAHSSEN